MSKLSQDMEDIRRLLVNLNKEERKIVIASIIITLLSEISDSLKSLDETGIRTFPNN